MVTASGSGKYIATKITAMIGTVDNGNRRGGQGHGKNKNIVHQKQQSTWLRTAYRRETLAARMTETTGMATTATIGVATMGKVSNTTTIC